MKIRMFATEREDVCGDMDVFQDVLEDISEDVKVPRWQRNSVSPRVNV